jgi:SWI/SNF-related matrix-associated actin-dependent regulator of chromatin subfamily A-like protein 1
MEPGLELFPFQEEGIRFALEHEGTLIADEMGLGKSVQAIGVINEDIGPGHVRSFVCRRSHGSLLWKSPTLRKIIIVCPASMRIPWRRELEQRLNRPLSIAVVGVDVGFIQTLFGKDVLIINWDRLSRFTKELSAFAYDLCVLDECHYTKSLEAQRTRAALAIKARRRIALSGMPLLNRPIEIYPILSWLSPSEWPGSDWFAFVWQAMRLGKVRRASHQSRATIPAPS